jgi:hypothetical protein
MGVAYHAASEHSVPLLNHVLRTPTPYGCFEKVGSLLSFSAAARVLGIPRSSVSRSVTRLEATLGAPLRQCMTRQLVLTEPAVALMAMRGHHGEGRGMSTGENTTAKATAFLWSGAPRNLIPKAAKVTTRLKQACTLADC